jgi:hypothetical protein
MEGVVMTSKVALYFLLDSTKAHNPQNYGMQLPVQQVASLYESLNGSCRFAKMSFPDSTVYGFSFFNKPFQTDMLVVLKDLNNLNQKKLVSQCQTQLAKLLNTQGPFYYANYLHRAVWMPRGLQKQEFINQLCLATGESEPDLEGVARQYLGDTWLMNYHQGYIFGGKHEPEFNRSLALYGLGLAYHRQLSLLVSRMALAAESGEEAQSGVKLDAARFAAQFLFDNPVRPAHQQEFRSYQHIVRGLQLEGLELQFRKKLADLMQLGQVKSAQQQLEGGWSDIFHRDQRKTAAAKPSAAASSRGLRNLVIGVIVGTLVAVGLLTLSSDPLALVQSWLK